FSVSTGASPRCAAGETYEWFKSAVNTANYETLPFGTAATATASFPLEGQYKVKAVITSPYSSISVSKEMDVTVGLTPAMLNPAYGIFGETCLDVKNSDQGKPLAFADRKYAFEGGFTKEYKFVHGSSYSGLSIVYLDDPTRNIVTGISAPSVSGAGADSASFTVTFNPNVRSMVPVNGDSLTVQLLASYKPNGSTETKYACLEIRVEDGTCICPAKKNTTEWLNYMCHNLGGLDIISPSQLITREHLGDWYMFGAKNASMKNTPAHDTNNTWDNPNYYTLSGDWPEDKDANIGNPCPAGWRLPTIAELGAVINKNASGGNITVINPITYIPATSWSNGVTVFNNLMRSGDYLFLPTNGWRRANSGELRDRGYYGEYISSTGNGTGQAWEMYFTRESTSMQAFNRPNGISVRCVAAE
ncbi:MAG: hypothetical protein LBM08_00070, partial [Dysgonamonadaceae bacterium]|nr:hypothetical protein [Dysgonamonadaceae bacterium]